MKEKIVIKESNKIFPCVPVRDIVVFPNMIMHFDVGRAGSIKVMKDVLHGAGMVFLVSQRDVTEEHPGIKDVYRVGTIAKVKQIIKAPNGIYRCLVEGIQKCKLLELNVNDDCYEAEVRMLPNYSRDKVSENEQTALFRELKDVFADYASELPRMPQELYTQIMGAPAPRELFEAVAFNIVLPFEDKQQLLELPTVSEKIALLLSVLSREIDVMRLEAKIHEQVHAAMEQNQREFYIREQIKALQNELGEGDLFGEDSEGEIRNYVDRIAVCGIDEESASKLLDEVKRLSRMAPGSQEAAVIRNYLDICLDLPWNSRSESRTDIAKAQKILDKDHYGMKKVKDRILENLAVMELSGGAKGQIICLAGPPGVGKTSIGRSVARALGREYVRVSLGGVRDESDIRGHRKTYVGAMPGRIINALRQAGTKNPLILLDEIDKMGNDFRGDPSSAMLEVLDSEQNVAFRDHFVELPFDLSEVLFITTANTLDTIAPPLLDRMDVIELSSYTREEKFNIAKKHLVPKQLEKNGLKASQVKFSNDALYGLIDSYTREAGVRKLERAIGSLCRKAAKEILRDGAAKISFRNSNLEDYLGHRKYLDDLTEKEDRVGCVNGLAWTSVGGVIMPLEVLVLDGKGKIELTGSLGDVMKESARIAVSLVRSIADKYGISADFYEKKDIHIHAPEGAVPKDGPSAGVTMTTALVSALSGIPVRADVAMTGEITLRGRVLPIGGLREKTMAAYRAGKKTVIIPAENMGDLDEVDENVKLGLEFVFAKNIEDVLESALKKPQKKSAAKDLSRPAAKRTKKTADAAVGTGEI